MNLKPFSPAEKICKIGTGNLLDRIFCKESSNLFAMKYFSGVTRYLEFKSVEGSYVLGKSGKISKVL